MPGLELCTICGEKSTFICSSCSQVCYCSKTCQKKDWKDHKTSCTAFTIQDLPGKGRGLVTRKDVKSGNLILKEKAQILLKVDDVNEEKISEIVDNLKQENQTKFKYLKSKKENSGATSCDIFLNNAVHLDDGDCGVFLTIAMVNHSCTPNAAWGNTEKADTLELRAIKDIPAEREVTVNYISDKCLLMSPNERNKLLVDTWGFSCKCEACENDTDEGLRNLLNMLKNKSREKLCLNQIKEVYKLHNQKVLSVRTMKSQNHQELLTCLQVHLLLAVFSRQTQEEVKDALESWGNLCDSDGLYESRKTLRSIEESLKDGVPVHEEEFFDETENVRKEWIQWLYNKL